LEVVEQLWIVRQVEYLQQIIKLKVMMVMFQLFLQLHLQVEVVEVVMVHQQELEEMVVQVVVELMALLRDQEIHPQQIHHKVTMEEDQIHQVVVEEVVEQPLQELQDRQQLIKVLMEVQEHLTQF
jgi:hypothetical protein